MAKWQLMVVEGDDWDSPTGEIVETQWSRDEYYSRRDEETFLLPSHIISRIVGFGQSLSVICILPPIDLNVGSIRSNCCVKTFKSLSKFDCVKWLPTFVLILAFTACEP